MTAQKKILKGIIIFILAVFLLSTALMSVMYFVTPSPDSGATTGENLTGIVDTTTDTGTVY